MREILFRGKDLQGSWVYGGINIDSSGCYIISNTLSIGQSIKVIRYTIGQYTGLIDKDGNKIFEGDIVKCTDERNKINFIAIIEFGNPNYKYNWGWQLHIIKGNTPNIDILLWVDMEESGAFIDIIGNIIDNPDLLK